MRCVVAMATTLGRKEQKVELLEQGRLAAASTPRATHTPEPYSWEYIRLGSQSHLDSQLPLLMYRCDPLSTPLYPPPQPTTPHRPHPIRKQPHHTPAHPTAPHPSWSELENWRLEGNRANYLIMHASLGSVGWLQRSQGSGTVNCTVNCRRVLHALLSPKLAEQ